MQPEVRSLTLLQAEGLRASVVVAAGGRVPVHQLRLLGASLRRGRRSHLSVNSRPSLGAALCSTRFAKLWMPRDASCSSRESAPRIGPGIAWSRFRTMNQLLWMLASRS